MSDGEGDVRRELAELRQAMTVFALNQAELASALAAFGQEMTADVSRLGYASSTPFAADRGEGYRRLLAAAARAQSELTDLAGELGRFEARDGG